ncbi:hypothetical protein Tsp_09022 [Trichinella spiralis]|uniref:hypothetical protein n=1 Tax=Trichinella spiralis TaxID=6334 RepID=UPI0001EFC56F|nr:hypothetical protein Tsp_09022 [Trichinella spiralis]
MESDEIQGSCYTLKRTNHNDKCWICASGTRGCPGKLYTNIDATKVIRTGEHAEGCRVDAHAFYHQQQLNEVKRLAAGDPRPVLEIYDELASNASTSAEAAAHFLTWEQTRNTMYYTRSKRYPRLPARRQDLRLTGEQTTTKSARVASGNKNSDLERSWCVCADQQPSGRLAQPHEQKSTRAPPEFLQLILDEQGKTETVVRQIDDGYAHGRGSVRRSAAYGVQQRRVAALTGKLVHNEITVEHF